jgi:hypothetical protein
MRPLTWSVYWPGSKRSVVLSRKSRLRYFRFPPW